MLTVDGYPGILTRYAGSYVRVNSHPSYGIIGSNTDKVIFWTSPTGYNMVIAQNIGISSDSCRKQNITSVDCGLSVIMALEPRQYTLKADSANPEPQLGFGFIAQEVETIIPEIVDTVMGEKILRIDEIIPFLVDAVQTQQAMIDSLTQRVVELEQCDCKIKNKMMETPSESDSTSSQATEIFLGQNNPNPFKESTVINYTIPENTKSAQIIVYDMTGKQLEVYELDTFGRGSLTIEGSTFKAGMYIYALLVDGQFIDSKKMILSK